MKTTQRRLARAITLAILTSATSTALAQPVDLGLLGEQGIRFDGASGGDYAGRSVSGAGDINGDGIPDSIVGAFGVNRDAGEAYVVFGRKEGDDIDLSDIRTDGFTINRAFADSYTGFSVSGAGDMNGDGLDDVVIGAPVFNLETGMAYVVFGKNDSRPVDLSDLGTNGFVIEDSLLGRDRLGISVAGAGDVNGDGLDDVVVGHPYTDFDSPTIRRSGSAYVIFGKDNSRPVDVRNLGDEGTTIQGASNQHQVGHRVSGAGDVNGDGLADLLIGTRDGDRAYVIFGQAVANTVNTNALGLRGYVITTGALSTSVSGAGDVNGDGYADMIIGAALAAANDNGEAYVVFGKPDLNNVSVTSLGTGGFVINAASTDGRLGSGVAGAGDVNGDGLADVIVGAPDASYTNTTDNGVAYLVLGKNSSADVNLGTPDSGHRYLFGAGAGDRAGRSVSGAGDVNDDGLADLLVGASRADIGGNTRAGSTYLVFSGGSQPSPNPSPVYRQRSGAGDIPRMAIGVSGDRSNHTTPDSRVWIDFSAGTGFLTTNQSTQTVRLHRNSSPLPDPGADVYWEVSADRVNYGTAEVTFRYLESDVIAPSEEDLRLFTAPDVSGPYTEIPATLDTIRNTLTAEVTELGSFFIGQGPRPDPLFSDSFEE